MINCQLLIFLHSVIHGGVLRIARVYLLHSAPVRGRVVPDLRTCQHASLDNFSADGVAIPAVNRLDEHGGVVTAVRARLTGYCCAHRLSRIIVMRSSGRYDNHRGNEMTIRLPDQMVQECLLSAASRVPECACRAHVKPVIKSDALQRRRSPCRKAQPE